MSSIIEKLGSYQILTNFIPGAFFGLTIKYFFGISFPTGSLGEDIAVYYFFGFFLSRIGSLVIEPVLKKTRFIKFTEYADYINAAKVDSKIDTLSETNNLFRSFLAGLLLLPLTKIAQILILKWAWLATNWKWILLGILFLLILFSYRKQTVYVRNRVDTLNKKIEVKNSSGISC